jgi:hypothetical protein
MNLSVLIVSKRTNATARTAKKNGKRNDFAIMKIAATMAVSEVMKKKNWKANPSFAMGVKLEKDYKKQNGK